LSCFIRSFKIFPFDENEDDAASAEALFPFTGGGRSLQNRYNSGQLASGRPSRTTRSPTAAQPSTRQSTAMLESEEARISNASVIRHLFSVCKARPVLQNTNCSHCLSSRLSRTTRSPIAAQPSTKISTAMMESQVGKIGDASPPGFV
jgi:hypothetical protein